MNTFLTFLKSKKFLVGVAVVAVLAVIEFGYPVYRDWKFDRELQQLTDEINKPYLEDTYGGKTPKETLEMFIAAVENGDYDLASKYFVLSKQEEWKGRLMKGRESDRLGQFVNNIKRAEDRGSLWEGNFQMEVKSVQDGLSLVIEFIKYPQGIWKIKEI